MRHHGQVAAIRTAYPRYPFGRTVGVARVGSIAVFQRNMVEGRIAGQRELALTVGNPDAQTGTAQGVKHHRVVPGNVHVDKAALELMGIIVQHLRLLLIHGGNQAQMHHQLTTVTHPQAEGVRPCVKAFQSGFGLFVVQKGTRPALGGAQHIGVGEPAHEHNQLDVIERFPPGNQVGHVHIPDIKSGQVHDPGHFAVPVGALFADDGRAHAPRSGPGRCEAQGGESPGEAFREGERKRLDFVIVFPGFGHFRAALQTVEQVGGAEPGVPQGFNIKFVFHPVQEYPADAFRDGLADGEGCDSVPVKCLQNPHQMGFFHLKHPGRILAEQHPDEVRLTQHRKVGLEAPLLVGKGHLQ